MWRVSSKDGSRWVQWDGPGDVRSQPAQLLLDVLGTAPVEVAPMSGDWYTPRGAGDPVAVFLRARTRVGGGVRVTGQAPQVPAAGTAAAAGVVY